MLPIVGKCMFIFRQWLFVRRTVDRVLPFLINNAFTPPVAKAAYRGAPAYIIPCTERSPASLIVAAVNIQPAVKYMRLRIRHILPKRQIRVERCCFLLLHLNTSFLKNPARAYTAQKARFRFLLLFSSAFNFHHAPHAFFLSFPQSQGNIFSAGRIP